MDTTASTAGKEERLWAMLCHLSALLGHFFPFANIIAPLVIWMIKRDEMPLVRDQGKESVNFEISVSIYFIVSAILCVIIIGFVMLGVLYIAWIVLIIIASMKANEGVAYRYPFTIRFVK